MIKGEHAKFQVESVKLIADGKSNFDDKFQTILDDIKEAALKGKYFIEVDLSKHEFGFNGRFRTEMRRLGYLIEEVKPIKDAGLIINKNHHYIRWDF